MARVAFAGTLGASFGEGRYGSSAANSPGGSLATLATTAAGTLTTNVAAAVAVLVADGASPTQAHVNTLNTAWGLLATAIANANTAAAGDVILDIDTAVVTNQNAVRSALRKIMQAVDGSGLATG